MLDWAYTEMLQPEEALKANTEWLRSDPNSYLCYQSRFLCLICLGRYDEAKVAGKTLILAVFGV
jgi:tetratricopeptide (TPR) repeat protein